MQKPVSLVCHGFFYGKRYKMKKTLVESLKKNVKKYANYAAMFGILMLMSGQPVLATDATSAITGKFQSLFDLIGVICQAAGGVILLWNAFEIGTSMQSQEGSGAMTRSLKAIGGALIMLVAPTLATALKA